MSLTFLTRRFLPRITQTSCRFVSTRPVYGAEVNPTQTNDLLLGRRSVTYFEDTLPLNYESAVQDAINAARYAPNHKNTEPWTFYHLGEQAIKEICDLNYELVKEKKGEIAAAKKRERWLKIPGWLVVTSTASPDDELLDREDYAATSCAVQNLCLSLYSHGLGTKWTTGPVHRHVDFPKILKLSSSNVQPLPHIMGTVWYGSPLRVPRCPQRKRDINEILKYIP